MCRRQLEVTLAIALLASLAEAAEPVPDPGRVRLAYEDGATALAASGGDIGSRSAKAAILADWTVVSADEKRVQLRGKVLEARLEHRFSSGIETPAKGGDESCVAVARSGELEAIVTRTGALLGTSLRGVLGRAQVISQGGPPALGVVPAGAFGSFERVVAAAVFEAFLHLLPPAGGGPSARRIQMDAGTPESSGTLELSFAAPAEWKPGSIALSAGACRFAPAKSKTVELPVHPSRVTWSDRGRRRDEWTVRLEHPAREYAPGVLDTRGQLAMGASFSARWLGEGTPASSREEALDSVRLAAGQRFLFTVEADEELRAAAGGRVSRSSYALAARVAAVLTQAPAAPGAEARWKALLLEGSLRQAAVAGVVHAKQYDPASQQVVPSLAGVELELVTAAGGVAVSLGEASVRPALNAAAPRDPKRAEALREALRRALAASLRSSLASAVPGGDPLWEADLVDAAGKPSGSASAGVGPGVPEERTYQMRGRRMTRRQLPLEPRWPEGIRPGGGQGQSSSAVLIRIADDRSPVAAESTLSVGIAGEKPGRPREPPTSHEIRVQAKLEVRQIGGPRFRPVVAAPAAPPAPEPEASQPPTPPVSDVSPLPPPKLRDSAAEAVRRKVEAVLADLPDGWDGVELAIDRYARLEAAEARSEAAAAAHAEVVHRLAERVDAAALESLAPRLLPASPFAVRVLAMRLIAHAPGLKDAEKASAIAPLLADPDRYTVRFAGRFLGWIRDPASVEALIEALATLEGRVVQGKEEPSLDRELRLSLAGDLYRLLGEGASRTAAAGFRDLWLRRSKTLPADPFAPGTATSVTMVKDHRTFADVRGAPLAFLLDASSSMADPIPASGIPLPPGDGPANPGFLEKLEWARRDLSAILGELEPGTRVQVVSFNKTARALQPGFTTLSKATLAAARAALKGVKWQRGTNIHAALEKAFALTEVGSVCLLSDGHPTEGPGEKEIERDVFRWNYLRGARFVAASFTGDIANPDNLCSRLARQHFGWVRALDAGAQRPLAAAPQAPPPSLDDDED